MFGEMLDTTPKQLAEYYRRLAALSEQERLAIMSRLSRGVRRVAEAGIRQEHPEYTDAQVRFELAVRLYGIDIARKHFQTP